MKARKDRIGETKRNKQGLVMRIVEYTNNKNVVIEFPQTTERRKTTYLKFRRGEVTADLRYYPIHTDCTFGQAKFFGLGIVGVIIASIIALTILFV